MKNIKISTLKYQGKKSFEQLYLNYYKLIYFVSLNIVKDEEAAKDIMQETFVNFFNHIDDYSETGQVKQYLVTISKNLSYNHLKKKTNQEKVGSKEIDEAYSKDNQYSSVELKLTLENTLSLEESKIVIYKIMHDYSFQEIADEMSQSLGMVQSKYYKALEKLKKHFEKR